MWKIVKKTFYKIIVDLDLIYPYHLRYTSEFRIWEFDKEIP
jgi:hypothetical protein